MQTKKILILLILIILFLASSVEAYKYIENYNNNKNNITEKENPIEVTLEFWGLWDSSDSWENIIKDFENQEHVWNGKEYKVKVVYTKKDYPSYKEKLEESFQEEKSPSIYMINNYWLDNYLEKMEPLNRNSSFVEEYNLLDSYKLSEYFPANILKDVVRNSHLYGMPIYSDSLALYYNKDLFKEAEIDSAPQTWDELKKDIRKLTIYDRKGDIKNAGIALGAGANINRSCDIVTLLAMQSGGSIINSQGEIDLNKEIIFNTSQGEQSRKPGLNAIQFYMEFSDPMKQIYTWDNNLDESVKSFAEGKTAMMINYSYQKENLLVMNPDLNYGISTMPQIPNSTKVNISNYFMPVVSNQNSCNIENSPENTNTDCSKIAWSFLSFANENIEEYLLETQKASARLDIAEKQAENEDKIAAFANQITSSVSYNKFDDKIDLILIDMIDKISNDRSEWENKVDEAVSEIEKLKPNQ